MKLYASPDACSLAPQIALNEAGLPYDLRWVDLATKQVCGEGSYLDVNPKGKISSLVRDDGSVITENASVLSYIADLRREANLAPAPGTPERLKLLEWLTFITTELHKQVLWVSFNPHVPTAMKHLVRDDVLPKILPIPSRALATGPFLLGEQFTVADAYLYWTLTLISRLAPDELARHPNLHSFYERVTTRPSVAKAHAAEGAARAQAGAGR
jgi:glutathione S-transferase